MLSAISTTDWWHNHPNPSGKGQRAPQQSVLHLTYAIILQDVWYLKLPEIYAFLKVAWTLVDKFEQVNLVQKIRGRFSDAPGKQTN